MAVILREVHLEMVGWLLLWGGLFFVMMHHGLRRDGTAGESGHSQAFLQSIRDHAVCDSEQCGELAERTVPR